MAEIGSRLRDFQTSLDGANLELKHLGAHVQKNEFTKLLRDHKHTLKELKGEYEWRKTSSDKNALMDGAKPATSAADMTSADGLMKHGLDVQQSGTDSLQRTLRVVHETKDIGIDTVAKLDANTHQIEAMYGTERNLHKQTTAQQQRRRWARGGGSRSGISYNRMRRADCMSLFAFSSPLLSSLLSLCADNLTAIDTTLARSTKVIKRMARKMATDKVIWVFTFLVFAAVVTIIVWKQMKNKNKGDSTTSPIPGAGGLPAVPPIPTP